MLVLGQKKEPLKVVLSPGAKRAKGRKAQPEAYVVMAPITAAMNRRAGVIARKVTGIMTPAAELSAIEVFDLADAGNRELIRMAMLDWGGIGGPDGSDVELALTPDAQTRFATSTDDERPTGTIDLLLQEDEIVETIANAWTRPDSLRRAEKNGLSASQTGTGGAATAARITAGSPVASAPSGRKARRTAAKGARTASTRSARPPARKSGKP